MNAAPTRRHRSKTPVEVAFESPTRSPIASAVDRLARRGVTDLVAVPFFLSAPIGPHRGTGTQPHDGEAAAPRAFRMISRVVLWTYRGCV